MDWGEDFSEECRNSHGVYNYLWFLFTAFFMAHLHRASILSADQGEPATSTKTKEATRYAVNVFQEYLQSRGKPTDFETLPVGELNLCLADFYLNVRSRNGELYSKNSLVAIRQGIRRYLQDKALHADIDFSGDPRFTEASLAFKAAVQLWVSTKEAQQAQQNTSEEQKQVSGFPIHF